MKEMEKHPYTAAISAGLHSERFGTGGWRKKLEAKNIMHSLLNAKPGRKLSPTKRKFNADRHIK